MPALVRKVRLFRKGRNQALRIPREMEIEGSEALVHREGDRLIVQPVRRGTLMAVLARLQPLEESFPDVDEGLATLDGVTIEDEAPAPPRHRCDRRPGLAAARPRGRRHRPPR